VGSPGVVAELLSRGADPGPASPADFETPLAWAALASQYWGLRIDTRFLEVAEGPLYDWLDERLAAGRG
jgi:hypothetical protein